jgi:Carboxypeptidase regulatory-like domain/TonB dependent receptor
MSNPAKVSVRISVFSLVILLLMGGLTASMYAQGGVGTITGTVTDPKGLSVPQAKIVILNTDTNTARPDIMTTDSGNFTAAFLQPGHYQITVSKDGFQTVVRKDLGLQVGQTLTFDAAMTVGTSVSEITVTGEAPLIEPDRTDFSQGVSETLAAGLPLNGRRWEQFVLLTPGVTNDGGTGLVSYHGISGLFNNSTVDGVSNQQAFFSEDRGRTAVGYTYSLDAVKEFSVQSSAYSAEFGNAAGGQVNSVTKSGTNAMHGDLFYFLRYPSLNALDPYAKTHGSLPINGGCTGGTTLDTTLNQCIAPPSEHQRQQFGGSVGGPIIKDKLFYFVNYDGQRRSFPIIYTGPSSSNAATAVANLLGNNCGNTIATNPVTVATVPDTIPLLASGQCAAALGVINSNIGPQPRLANQDVALAKLDYQVTPNNRLSASFNYMNFRSPNGYDQTPTFSAGSIYQNGNFGTHDRFLVASWNSVISPTMVNDFRFQWSRDFQFYSSNFSGPSVAVGNLFAYGQRNALPRGAFPDEHRLQFADSLSWVHGNHAVKFGVDISPVHELLINLFSGGGVYSYNYSDSSVTSAEATLQAWVADLYNLALSSDTVTNAAKCIVGGVNICIGRHYNSYSQAVDVVNPAAVAGKDDFYDTHYGAYVQDAWKATPNVTLNMGLRWDMQDIPQPAHPFNTDPLALFYTQKIYISKLNFQPRFGFAWQVDKNTVIRVGYGMFFGNTTDSLFYNTRVENGVVQKSFSCNVGYSPSAGSFGAGANCLQSTPAIQGAPAFPDNLFAAPGPALAPLPLTGATAVTPVSLNLNPSSISTSALGIRGQSPHFLEPMVNEGEIAVEHEFPGGISASETFMLTKGQHLPTCPDVNIAPAGTPFLGTLNSSGVYVYNPTGAGAVMVTPPSTVTLTTTALTGNGLFANGIGPAAPPAGISVTVPFYTSRLDSGIGTISACESLIRSTYVAGITTVKKQFSHGFELLANYTLSKATDDGQVQGAFGTFSGSSDAVLDPYNIQGEQGYSDYDQRQRLIISTLYAPTFKVDSPFLNYLVNGFGISGVVTIASPMPVNGLMSSTTPPTTTFGANKFTGIDGGVTGGESLNTFTTPGRIPIVSKNFYRGNTQVREVDLRITRDFKFTERMKLQIIGEAFNVFNHTIVATVSSGAVSGTTAAYVLGGTSTALTLAPQAGFLAPTTTSSVLGGARQLQISGKFFF